MTYENDFMKTPKVISFILRITQMTACNVSDALW